MCQGDSIYDLVDHRDHGRIQVELMSGPPSVSEQNFFPNERVFICRMSRSRITKRQLQYHKVLISCASQKSEMKMLNSKKSFSLKIKKFLTNNFNKEKADANISYDFCPKIEFSTQMKFFR